MRMRCVLALLAGTILVAGCVGTGPRPTTPARPAGPGPSRAATVSVAPGQNTADAGGLIVSLRTSSEPSPLVKGGKAAPGKRWLTIDATARNSTDATVSAYVSKPTPPELVDRQGHGLQFNGARVNADGAVNRGGFFGAAVGPGPEGLRPGGSIDAVAWYQVPIAERSFTLVWILGPGRAVEFHLR